MPLGDVPRTEFIEAGLLQVHVPADMDEPNTGYQRLINRKHVEDLKANWNWSKCEALLVSYRLDGPQAGEYFIVNGQHRWISIREMFGENHTIKCDVLSLTYKEEAELFASQNYLRKKVSAQVMFRAELEAENPEVVDIKRTVEEAGWLVGLNRKGSYNNVLTSVAGLSRIYHDYGRDVLYRTLVMLREGYPEEVQGRTQAPIIQGMAYFLYHFPVARPERIKQMLRTKGAAPETVIRNAAPYQSINRGSHSRAGNAAVARVFLDLYNARMHPQNRLEWDTWLYRKLQKQAEREGRSLQTVFSEYMKEQGGHAEEDDA